MSHLSGHLPATAVRLRNVLQRMGVSARVLLLLVPLHLLGFLALYLGVAKIVEREILKTQLEQAHVLLEDALTELHPAMMSPDPALVRARLARFVAAHDLIDLRLYDPRGRQVPNASQEDTAALTFLHSAHDSRYWISDRDGSVRLHGMMRILASEDCVSCHPHGGTLGVAAMSLDLTPHYHAVRRGLTIRLGLVMAGWAVLVGLINVTAGRVGRRTVKGLQRAATEPGAGGDPLDSVSRLMMDGVAKELYESLESTLRQQRERNAEVADRLRDTERLASLGRLAGGLAHEIRNPLAGVRGGLELLLDEIDDPGQKSLPRQMLDELDRVDGTLQTLLRFARPGSPQRVPTDVRQLVQDTVQLLGPTVQRRGIRLETDVAPATSDFPLDPGKMRQALLNLITNAVEALPDGGRVRVRAAVVPRPRSLLISVEDDGPGIPEDELSRIFEPFYTTKFGGTGLGLTIARSLVVQHGGELQVSSQPGAGTKAILRVPEHGPPSGDGKSRKG